MKTQLLETSSPHYMSHRTPNSWLVTIFGAGWTRLIPSKARARSRSSVSQWSSYAYLCRLQGLPSQEAYDKALAIAQLVLGRLLPAYLVSLPQRPSNIHLYLPIPPMLSAGLTTPLPASLTGDARNVDKEDILRKGAEALDALETILASSDWALGAS